MKTKNKKKCASHGNVVINLALSTYEELLIELYNHYCNVRMVEKKNESEKVGTLMDIIKANTWEQKLYEAGKV